MLTRRECLALTAKTCAALALAPRLSTAQQQGGLMTRAIPSTGERLPIIGLGSSATFSETASEEDVKAIRAVIQTLYRSGGRVFDTAPSYGASEEVAGKVVNALGLQNKLFWATKLNVAGFFGGRSANREEALAQVDTSIRRLGREPIDLIQVHNLADIPDQLPILRELKEKGRVRYIGTTSTFKRQYDEFERVIRKEPLDFIGVDYAVDNLSAEKKILPLAQEKGIAVLGYMPFGRTRLWNRVAGHTVPEWASEFGADSWAQFFLKFAASHPAMTAVTPATSNPKHMLDDLGALRGRLPDAAERRRMVQFIEALPAA
ncbi:MAG TPA: aldo/keto reductase [Gammaproteobacteria bacterium]|nr:aldo/keto reductase [Gammaproteobacteria bacterium]